MDIINRSAFVLNLFKRRRCALALFDGRGDGYAIVLYANGGDMRLVPHPCRASTSEEPVLDIVFHGRAEVGVVLNLKVDGAFDQPCSDTPNGVVIAEASAYISLRQFGVDGRDERLDIRPQDVELGGFVAARASGVVAVTLDEFLYPRLPLGKLVFMGADDPQVLLKFSANGLVHLSVLLVSRRDGSSLCLRIFLARRTPSTQRKREACRLAVLLHRPSHVAHACEERCAARIVAALHRGLERAARLGFVGSAALGV